MNDVPAPAAAPLPPRPRLPSPAAVLKYGLLAAVLAVAGTLVWCVLRFASDVWTKLFGLGAAVAEWCKDHPKLCGALAVTTGGGALLTLLEYVFPSALGGLFVAAKRLLSRLRGSPESDVGKDLASRAEERAAEVTSDVAKKLDRPLTAEELSYVRHAAGSQVTQQALEQASVDPAELKAALEEVLASRAAARSALEEDGGDKGKESAEEIDAAFEEPHGGRP